MIEFRDLIESQLDSGEDPDDIINVLGFELGSLLASSQDEQPFEVVLHQLISKMYLGKREWEEENEI